MLSLACSHAQRDKKIQRGMQFKDKNLSLKDVVNLQCKLVCIICAAKFAPEKLLMKGTTRDTKNMPGHQSCFWCLPCNLGRCNRTKKIIKNYRYRPNYRPQIIQLNR